MSGDCKDCDFSYILRMSRDDGEVEAGSNMYCMHKLATVTLLDQEFPLLASRMREEGRVCGPKSLLWASAPSFPTQTWETVRRPTFRITDLPPGAELAPASTPTRKGVGHPAMKARRFYAESEPKS